MRDTLGRGVASFVADLTGADTLEIGTVVNTLGINLPRGPMGRDFGTWMCDWLSRDFSERNDNDNAATQDV